MKAPVRERERIESRVKPRNGLAKKGALSKDILKFTLKGRRESAL